MCVSTIEGNGVIMDDVRDSDAMKAELDSFRQALLEIRELASDPPISSDVLADDILAVIAGVIADDGKDSDG